MRIAVAGTGYVGLVTGVALAHVGHNVTCVDVLEEKIKLMRKGISPIYEDGLEELMKQNKDRLTYTTDYKSAYRDAEVIFIGVGTPERSDGSANLDYVYAVCDNIIESIVHDVVVVVKSTVPIGTNDYVEQYLRSKVKEGIRVSVASNPEFLSQGTSDTMVEWSHIKTGIEGDKGLNYITTSHTQHYEAGMPFMWSTQLYNGYTLREMNHSHPSSSKTSAADLNFKDGITTYKINNGYYPIPVFKIYHVPTKRYIKY